MSHTTENLTSSDQPVPKDSGKVIYTVTTLRIKDPQKHNRTVGWYAERAEAFGCLDQNLGDLVEAGYYQYAVVEEVPDGLYPVTLPDGQRTRRWFWKAVREVRDEGNWHWERLDGEPNCLKPDPTVAGGYNAYCQIG